MRVLILSFSEVSRDPRVLRQIRALHDHADLSVAGFGSFPDADLSFFSIGKKRRSVLWKILAFITLLLGFFRLHYWWQLEFPRVALALLGNARFDVILANDVNTLPLAFALSRGDCPVLLDAHEFSPGEFSGLVWRLSIGRLYHWICIRWLRKVELMSSVCHEIGDLYRAKYGKGADFIVYNVPRTPEPVGPISLPRESSSRTIRLVHHGSAEPERRLERMVQMMDMLDDRFSLDLFLVGHLSPYAKGLAKYTYRQNSVRVLPPLRSQEIVPALSQYDIGVYLLSPESKNNLFALPNKFFDFVQAGLALAIGPSPAMERIVRDEGLGVVASDFHPSSLAALLVSMTSEQLSLFQSNSCACRSRYTSELAEEEVLMRVLSLSNDRLTR